MREEIQKLAQGIAGVAQLLKEEKLTDATNALLAVSDGITALDEAVEKSDTQLEEVKKQIAEKDEAISKYANLSVSTDDLSGLIEELASVKTMISDQGIAQADIMKSVSTKDDIKSLSERMETLEKATHSRQLRDEESATVVKSAIKGFDLSPR